VSTINNKRGEKKTRNEELIIQSHFLGQFAPPPPKKTILMLSNGDSLGKKFEKPSKWVPTKERGKIKIWAYLYNMIIQHLHT
jgi:hypothetical protein